MDPLISRLLLRALHLGASGVRGRRALLRAGIRVASSLSDDELRKVLEGAQPYRRKKGEPLVHLSFAEINGEHAKAALLLRQRITHLGGREASDLLVVAFSSLERLDDSAFAAVVAGASVKAGPPRRAKKSFRTTMRSIHPEERRILDALKKSHTRAEVLEEAFTALRAATEEEVRILFESLRSIPQGARVQLKAGWPDAPTRLQAEELMRRLQRQRLLDQSDNPRRSPLMRAPLPR